ncbi:NF-kappa-B-repressing factor [Pseudolycoriella hygida]|uniref:NF-kappa-B-repressing factor n=1 Tax=Pseudolycoriella hygida TaxID=35572 RepID=A0A9Q0MVG4_9DIPT|nr:NF-kappa-B-repressing factor [Pseudolycoriella hygida]
MNWDVEVYKTDYESEEHWELRRLFMETHKDKFEEDELVCLAQVFTNVEFMGCKYPDKTMRKVALLSKEVAEDFRKKRATKLKRTFVGAQDAAGAKAKGRRTIEENNTSKFTKPIQFTPQTPSTNTKEPKQQIIPSLLEISTKPPQNANLPSKRKTRKRNNDHLSKFCNKSLRGNKYDNIIIFELVGETNSHQILQSSAAKQRAVLDVTYTGKGNEMECCVLINKKVVATAVSSNKKDAKTLATDAALQELKKMCYTLKKKPEVKSTKIETTMGSSNSKTKDANTSTDQFSSNQLNENNKGFKMMKLLGWSGGALSAGGIETPIGVQIKVDRMGLGLTNDTNHNLNKRFFSEYLQKYNADPDNIHELIFSKDFTKEERATLHTIAAKQGLKSNSKNTPDGDRYLIISKKIPLDVLATNVLNGGIYTEMYDLIHPSGNE